jgi:hypothetical protein
VDDAGAAAAIRGASLADAIPPVAAGSPPVMTRAAAGAAVLIILPPRVFLSPLSRGARSQGRSKDKAKAP